MENGIAIVVPPFVRHVEYDENSNLDMILDDQEAYQSLLDMGFNPVDETGLDLPLNDRNIMCVMDRQTIFYEFEQLHNGAGNQVLREHLNQNGRVVLISKDYETYVFQPQLVQNR